MTDCKNQ